MPLLLDDPTRRRVGSDVYVEYLASMVLDELHDRLGLERLGLRHLRTAHFAKIFGACMPPRRQVRVMMVMVTVVETSPSAVDLADAKARRGEGEAS